MGKGLAALVRLHTWQVDEKRRELAARLRTLEELESRLHALEDELAREQQAARSLPEAGLYFGTYANGVRTRRRDLAVKIAAADAEVEKARETVRVAFHELKKYEQAEDARRRAEQADLARRERVDLDEIGLQGHRRRQQLQ